KIKPNLIILGENVRNINIFDAFINKFHLRNDESERDAASQQKLNLLKLNKEKVANEFYKKVLTQSVQVYVGYDAISDAIVGQKDINKERRRHLKSTNSRFSYNNPTTNHRFNMPSVSVKSLDSVTRKQPTKLRVFIMQSAHGLFVSSGGFKANLYLADGLLRSGYDVKMIALGLEEEVMVFGEYTKEILALGPTNSFQIYRHSYNGIDTVTVDANDWRKLFDGPGSKRRVNWIEDIDPFLELE
ncbi:hypothetical protein K7432_016749, partial [Basidiobolus ranarum]